MSELVIKDLHVSIEGKEILKGLISDCETGRNPCHHGPQWHRKIHPGLYPDGAPFLY